MGSHPELGFARPAMYDLAHRGLVRTSLVLFKGKRGVRLFCMEDLQRVIQENVAPIGSAKPARPDSDKAAA